MDIEVQTNENTRNIAELTTTVTKLATVMGYEVERAKEDRNSVKDMVAELKDLNQKITGMASVQKDMAQADKEITELRARVDQLKEWKDKYDLSNMSGRITALETVNTKDSGVKEAVSTGAEWFWRIFGNAIVAAMMGGMAYYFSHNGPNYSHIEETTRRGALHGTITGE